MQGTHPIDPSKLDFFQYSKKDDFSNLDFKQIDGSDPLNVDGYIHDNPAHYIENRVSTIYSVRYDNNLIGYFTLSMSNIGKKEMLGDDALSVPFRNYPALLLGQIGVDINHRRGGIGQRVCSYCSGLGQVLNEKAACAFLILQTTPDLARNYYEPKCHFKWKPSDKNVVWMYRKLF